MSARQKILLERTVLKLEVIKSIVWGLFVAMLLGVAVVVGSRNLSRFDSALVAYTFASLFAAFGLTYRYASGFNGHRPHCIGGAVGKPSLNGRTENREAINWFKRVTADFALNHFHLEEGKIPVASPLVDHVGLYRCVLDHLSAGVWLADVLIRTWRPGELSNLCVRFSEFDFKVESIFGFLLFHVPLLFSLRVDEVRFKQDLSLSLPVRGGRPKGAPIGTNAKGTRKPNFWLRWRGTALL